MYLTGMKYGLTFLVSFLVGWMTAQSPDSSVFANMHMRHIGPGTMSGRVTAIAVETDDPKVIYVGTASGGLWKSNSGGITWQAMFDEVPEQSIGALCIDPSNPDVIWAGTGEGNPRNSHNSGAGIYRSADRGKTWQPMGLTETRNIHRIVVHRNDPNTVWVAAMGSAWGAHPERGVFKTSDGGKTWRKVLYSNDLSGCAELVADPRNPEKLYAALYEHYRKPWTFQSGGEGSGFYVSYDGGENWQQRTHDDGLPKAPLGRMGIAVSAANPDVVYALVEAKKTGLYKSTNGGKDFELVSTRNIGNRPFYYAEIHAHPSNENTLFNLYSLVSKSIDGGKNFEVILPYSGAHPDHHAFYIHPKNPEFMVNGNDGGLNISRDGGKTWEFISNLPLGQFYHIDYDLETPYNVYGGMQDNGSWVGPAYVWHSEGIRNDDWRELYFGDGFDVAPDNRGYAYAMSQGGNVARIHLETGQSHFVRPQSPDSTALRFNWNAPIAIDPHNPDGVYFGSQFVHYSPDNGQSWRVLSPDLTTNDPEKQQQAKSGGLTIDATNAENHTTLLCIAPDPHDKKVIWAGSDDGKLHVTRDGGKTWNSVYPKAKELPAGAWIPQIVPSTHKSGEAFVVINDYRRNNRKPYLFHTTDFGAKWTNLTASDEVESYCLSVVQDPVVPELLFLGTENGLYYSLNKGKNWAKWTVNYPSVSTMDLKIHPVEHDLIIGTFGRGAYILDDIRPLRAFVNGQKPSSFEAFQAPTAYHNYWRRNVGERFHADHHWSAPNKTSGGAFSYFLAPDSVNDDDDKARILCKVTNAQGDTIRSFKFKPSKGIARASWDLKEDGVFGIRRKKPAADELPGGGAYANPGTYTVHLSYKGMSTSTTVEVKTDPRINPSELDFGAQRRAWKAADAANEAAGLQFTRLREAREQLGLIKSQLDYLKNSDDTATVNAVQPKLDSLLKQISQLEDAFMLAEDFEGYDHVTERIDDTVSSPYWYLSSPGRVPGANVERAIQRAREASDRIGAEVDAFFTKHYTPFIQSLELPRLNDVFLKE